VSDVSDVSEATPAPLLDLFKELRARSFPLGVGDYLAVLGALANGVGANSRDDLVFMCSVLWGKTREEQRQIERLLNSMLPARLTAAEIEALAEPVPNAKPNVTPSAGPPQTPPDVNVNVPKPDAATRPLAMTTAPEVLNAGRGGAVLKRTTGAGGVGAALSFAALPLEGAEWRLDPKLDLTGTLPVTRRQVKTAWRYFRRMQRTGTPTELDVAATVERAYRQGVFLRPVLIPRRVNLARLLILADEGGSMVPFRRVTEPLLETARHSGLALVSIFFFHDVAGRSVFRDPLMNEPVSFKEAVEDFDGAGVLVLSDAGAARGMRDARRVRTTARFVAALRQVTANVAWINPVPRSRWQGTTAEDVRRECAVPMFPLDREGIYAAVERLRGR
jgi:uncharacterized protein with von Willebrand factor type A (vWA) domain